MSLEASVLLAQATPVWSDFYTLGMAVLSMFAFGVAAWSVGLVLGSVYLPLWKFAGSIQ